MRIGSADSYIIDHDGNVTVISMRGELNRALIVLVGLPVLCMAAAYYRMPRITPLDEAAFWIWMTIHIMFLLILFAALFASLLGKMQRIEIGPNTITEQLLFQYPHSIERRSLLRLTYVANPRTQRDGRTTVNIGHELQFLKPDGSLSDIKLHLSSQEGARELVYRLRGCLSIVVTPEP